MIFSRTSFVGAAPASALKLRRATIAAPVWLRQPKRHCAAKVGGARRDRTDDLLLAKQALSQLSYGPVRGQRTDDRGQIKRVTDKARFRRLSSVFRRLIMVGLGRFELPTSRLSSARSNQLSYKPGSEDRGRTTDDRPSLNLSSVVCHLSPEQLVREERETETAASCQVGRRMTDDGGQKSFAPASSSDNVFLSSDESEQRTTSVVRPLTSVIRILRKEVIQPQVPLRLPCYDFTPVADPTVAGCILAVCAPS